MMMMYPSASVFSLYHRDLVCCQRKQSREDGYVGAHAAIPFDTWLRYFGWRKWEGNLRHVWRGLMCEILEPDTMKILNRLLELWEERREVWMRPGGYLVKVDGHRRGALSAPVHKRTSPPPWRLALPLSRQNARNREPDTTKLNAEIDEAYASFNSALETHDMRYKLPIMVLALAGSIKSGASIVQGE